MESIVIQDCIYVDTSINNGHPIPLSEDEGGGGGDEGAGDGLRCCGLERCWCLTGRRGQVGADLTVVECSGWWAWFCHAPQAQQNVRLELLRGANWQHRHVLSS